MVYSGYSAGSYYTHTGSGSDAICLHPQPTFLAVLTANNNQALIYGVEYESDHVVDDDMDNGDAACNYLNFFISSFFLSEHRDCPEVSPCPKLMNTAPQ